MSEPAIFFEDVNERQGGFLRRTLLFGGATGLVVTALTGRLAYLQLIEASRYATLSEGNQFNYRLVPPPRGRVLDRSGVVLAGNRPSFRVLVVRDETKDLNGTLDEVASLLPDTADRRKQILRDVNASPRFVPVPVKTDLTWDEFAKVNLHQAELSGVMTDMNEARYYPYGGAFAHVIGYVGKVSDKDVAAARENGGEIDPILYNPSFRVGKQGIEKAFDQQLRGKPGGQKVEVDSKGRVVGEDPNGSRPAVPGADIVLTLDADIQNRALEVFGQDSGAAVMMDIRTGDVLCMTSAPSFDANAFVGGVPGPLYRALSEYDRKPLLDKALSATFPPGSTFKTMVALAALENGFDPKRTYTCNGVFAFGNHVFHCDKHHGTLDLHGAIVTSCDVYFYQTALSCGPDKIAAVARQFGLGQIFDIGITGQRRGLVPDTDWKRRTFKNNPANQKWFPGETPSMGIGQGYTNINALQSCVMVSRLANGRKALQPRLVRSVGGALRPEGDEAPDLAVDKAHVAFVRKAMADVVISGTAASTAKLGLGSVMMAGKTGTAQAHTYGGGHGAHGAVGAWDLRDHAWFVAFAPADDPRYAISVIVEHGGFGGEVAAPKAREIMKTALLKDPDIRARIQTPMPGAEDSSVSSSDDDVAEGAAPEPPTPIPGAPGTPV